LRKLLQIILNFLAKLYIFRYRPTIIAVTGNVGKTSTKEAIAAVLKKEKKVRVSGGNLNNEFGVPLTIIGNWHNLYYESGGNIMFWLLVIVSGFLGLIFYPYPKILVLEYAADRPGDIRKLVKKFKPHIGVITEIGELPVHVEYFSGPDALVREKSKLVERLKSTDFAVLKYDDKTVLDIKEKTRAQVITYGFGEGAKVRVSDFDFNIGSDGQPLGISFRINYGESTFIPIKIEGSLGKSQAYAAAAATAVGLILKMNLVEINEALSLYRGPSGRLRILPGIKKTWIIDDTYNASPSSMKLAIETLKSLPSKRKIAVLGDMLELGQYTEAAHREIGNFIGGYVDILICVGLRAKFIADSAANQMPKENILTFENANLANKRVQEIIKEGDLILIKGSQGIRTEKIVEEIMAEPEKKNELLVRQSKKWLSE